MHPADILLVEDNAHISQLIQCFLQAQNLRVKCIACGSEALREWERGEYKLIIMDLELPQMNGLDITRQIREVEARQEKNPIPIIAFTAFVDAKTRSRCEEVGIDEFIAKPAVLREFRQIIDKYLPR